jgi:hypothetical protein
MTFSWVDFDLLFSRLSIKNIVKVVSLMLLECHCVFTSSSASVLSMSILSLRELCRPFVHQTTFVPVLPDCRGYLGILGILDSPVPFVCGLLKSTRAVQVPSHCVVIDLDDDAIYEPCNMPDLPAADEIARQLTNLLATHDEEIRLPGNKSRSFGNVTAGVLSKRQTATIRLHPYKVAWMYEEIVDQYNLSPKMIDEIIDIFGNAINVDTIVRQFLVTDRTDHRRRITAFHKDLFLESLTERQRKFFTEFLATTMFSQFLHGMIDTLDSQAWHLL